MTLEEEEQRLAELLTGKTVSRVFRGARVVGFEFTDGTRFFADVTDGAALDLSVTGGEDP